VYNRSKKEHCLQQRRLIQAKCIHDFLNKSSSEASLANLIEKGVQGNHTQKIFLHFLSNSFLN
jgi:hypothetical protein